MSHLSAETYRVCSVLDHVKKYKVVCVSVWHDSLLLGCSDGALRLIESDEERVVWRERILDEEFGGSKKSIESIRVVEFIDSTTNNNDGHNHSHSSPNRGHSRSPSIVTASSTGDSALLVAIVSGVCRVYALPSMRAVSLLSDSKGCHTIALSTNRHAPSLSSSSTFSPLSLCVATKKKLLMFYSWQDAGSASAQISGEFQFDFQLSLEDSVKCLCFVDRALIVGTSKEYLHVANIDARSAQPSVTRLFEIGRKQPSPLACLIRAASAQSAKSEVLLVQDSRGICVGSDGKPSRKDGVNFSETPLDLSFSAPHLISLSTTSLEVRNLRTGVLTQTISVREGTKWLAHTQGSSIYVGSSSSIRCLYAIPMRELIDDCLSRGAFKEAISFVQLSDESQWRHSGEKEARLKEIYVSYASQLFNDGDYQQSMQYFQRSQADPRAIIALFPDASPSAAKLGAHTFQLPRTVKAPNRVTSAQGEQTLLIALAALIPYLAQMQTKIRMVQEQQQHPQHMHDLDLPEDIDLPALSCLIDTALLKAYLLSDIPILPFLEQPNNCDVDECSAVLRTYEKYPELICLWQQRSKHSEALELLQLLGQANNPNASAVALAMRGTKPIVAYLQTLATNVNNDEPLVRLILEHSIWPLKEDPVRGLTIFTHCHTQPQHEHATQCIDSRLVASHLREHGTRQQLLEWLESLIQHCHETDATFHNELIALLLESLLKLMKAQSKAGSSGNLAQTQEIIALRTQLLDFLRSSHAYNPERFLSKFPRNHLLQERCILLSRLGLHEEALEILAHRLRDPVAAEMYCINTGRRAAAAAAATMTAASEKQNKSTPELLTMLIKVYLAAPSASSAPASAQSSSLSPSQSAEPNVSEALKLLTKHFRVLDPMASLSILPASMPLRALTPYVTRVLRHQQHQHRSQSIVRQLLRAEQLALKWELTETSSGCLIVDEMTQCDHCSKKIGVSNFIRHPDGRLVHFACQKRFEQSSAAEDGTGAANGRGHGQ